MDKEDLKNHPYFNFKQLKKNFSNKRSWVGKTVLWIDRGYGEYGIVLGYTDTLVVVSFPNYRTTPRIRTEELYFPILKPNFNSI